MVICLLTIVVSYSEEVDMSLLIHGNAKLRKYTVVIDSYQHICVSSSSLLIRD